ncbi:MAG TPA: hypothetical protein VNW47_03345 [Terriglobales bacterium]|jgi:hypothetical protein|nr:hypothetical protein [Terriglobales bacterium]
MKHVRYPVAVAVVTVLAASFALAESGSQKTFETLKALEGTWEGKNSEGQGLKITFRET